MSRRDTIIIAVLVNAALLMILFATAMHSDGSKKDVKKIQSGDVQLAELTTIPQKSPEKSSHDELLNEFVASVPTLAESTQENVLSFEETELVLALNPSTQASPVPLSSPQPIEDAKALKPKTDQHYVHVTVKKGDFLEKIAKGNNTTIAAIMQANNLSSTQLKVGQVLKIPLHEEKKGEKKAPSAVPVSQDSEFYTVKEGDNPWLIASRNRINLEELLRLNGLDEQKAKRLRPGDKLRIR